MSKKTMLKINLNFNLLDLESREIENANCGKMVANLLVSANKGDILKYYDWAMKLHSGIDLEIDRSDLDKLKAFIETNESMTILAKAQIIDKLK